MGKFFEVLNKLARIYFKIRPKSYTRITRYAIGVAALIASPSLLELILEYIFKYTIDGFEGYNGFEYAFWIVFFALVFHYFSDITDKAFRRFDPYRVKKEEQDKSSISAFKKIFNYDYMKRNLERAEYGVFVDFVDSLSLAEVFLDPKYKLHDSELEDLRIELIKEIIDYNYFLSNHLYPIHGNYDQFVIPAEWKHDPNLKSKFKDHEEKIEKRSSKLILQIHDFYLKAKSKLLIESDS